MEDPPHVVNVAERWSDDFNRILDQHRARIREFQTSWDERMGCAHRNLSSTIEQTVSNLAENEADRRQQRIDEQSRQIEGLKAEIEATAARRTEMAVELAAMREREAETVLQLQMATKRHEEIAAEMAGLRQKNMERDLEWESVQHALRQMNAEIEAARNQSDQKAAELNAAKHRSDQLAAELEAARSQSDQKAAELNAAKHRSDQLTAELEAARNQSDQSAAELNAVKNQSAIEINAAQHQPNPNAIELEAAQRQSEQLAVEIESIRQQSEQTRMELEARNEALETQLQEALAAREEDAAAASAKTPSAGGCLDWEAEKRRIIAALESEGEEGNENRQQQRVEINEVIRETDKAIHDRNREIAELRKLLEDQSNSLGSVAIGAAAFGEILDKDEIIREERESLKCLQKDWEEKLRQAEIEISLERATIARERAQLNEQRRVAEASATQATAIDKSDHRPEKPVRGRWLSRLGLKDEDSGR
jgi:chromosome segregation ATPase